MIWQFHIIIRVFFKPFQSQKCLISFVLNIFFCRKNFCMIFFLVHFSSFFLKYGVMENLVEFYIKIQKLVTFLLLIKTQYERNF
jgi:hypothetical protein